MKLARLARDCVVVLDVAEADVSVDAETESGWRGEAAEDAVAVDGFTAPRPRLLVNDVVINDELKQALANAFWALTNQCRVADETTLL